MQTVKSSESFKQIHSASRDLGIFNSSQKIESRMEYHDLEKLNKKIRTIKLALKNAEQHNEDLHQKIKANKQSHQTELIKMQSEIQKYKSLYDMLIQNYDSKSDELKEAKRKIKRLESSRCKLKTEEYHHHSQRQLHLMLAEKETQIEQFQQQNILLREEIVVYTKKVTELERRLQKSNQQAHNFDYESLQRQEVSKLKQKLSNKKEQIHKLKGDLSFLESSHKSLKNNNELYKQEVNTLKKQVEALKHENDRLASNKENLRVEMDMLRVKSSSDRSEDGKWKALYEEINQKYSDLLTFSYDIQRDYERELHTMAKEMTRRYLVKESANNHESSPQRSRVDH